jgi:hypothetical protein
MAGPYVVALQAGSETLLRHKINVKPCILGGALTLPFVFLPGGGCTSLAALLLQVGCEMRATLAGQGCHRWAPDLVDAFSAGAPYLK